MLKGRKSGIGVERNPRATRVRIGSYELKKMGVSRFDVRDPYHFAVALTWPRFLATLLAIYALVNVVFATLYWLIPGSVANARPHSFGDAFFFSIETLATVGYGEMYPKTPYGHVIAAMEIVCGLGFTAIVTGLTFVRFSRPRAKLIFAPNPVVALHNGKPTLMVRVGNGRPVALLEAERAPYSYLARGQTFSSCAGVTARASAPSRFSSDLDAHACAGRAEPLA